MSSKTKNLGLFKYDTTTDGKQVFSIDKGMNENWDTIDSNTLAHRHITNCLLDVPQRIKLELSGGTLTLKAGSVVIAPFGTLDLTSNYPIGSVFQHENFIVVDTQFTDDKFFVWAEVQSDMECVAGAGNMTAKCFIDFGSNTFRGNASSDVSGSVAPTYNAWWYDTTNNTLGFWVADNQVLIRPNSSFPLSIATTVSQKITSIDQVFNGMGYIGSTIWVDKGVKGLIPNGRNEDGSLKNIEKTLPKIWIYNNNPVHVSEWYIWHNLEETNYYRNAFCLTMYFQDAKPNIGSEQYATWFSPLENLYRDTNDNGVTWTIRPFCNIFRYKKENSTILEVKPKLPFRAVDYNDKPEISGWAMPSSNYRDLTLGANNSQYTAPANGWFTINRKINSANPAYVYIANTSNGLCTEYSIAGSNLSAYEGKVFIPVLKGDVIQIGYNLTGTINYFRFVYAQGEV